MTDARSRLWNMVQKGSRMTSFGVPHSQSRRNFLKTSTAAGIGLLAGTWVKGAQLPPSERINVAFIGTGNQGMHLLRNLLKHDLAQVVAVCDVNTGSLGYKGDNDFYGREPAQAFVNEHYAKTQAKGGAKPCRAFVDFRDVLALPDVDAVFIVTPDHWHAPMCQLAAAAGKHIYCEKPATLTIAEGKDVIKAVRENKVIFQTGSHERSNPVSRFVIKAVQDGKIGQVQRVITKIGYNNKVGPGPGWTPMPVPEGFDYERWLGPAPEAPYHQDRCLYRFRFNYDYAGGQIANFGAHCNDLAQWGLGMDRSGPVEFECLSATFLPEGSLFNTATETRFRARYANGVELICESGPENVQARFEGTEGWIQTGYRGTTASDPELLNGLPKKDGEDGLIPHARHMKDFIDAVRENRDPSAPVEVGHYSSVLGHVANIAIRAFPETGPGQVYHWDPEKEEFQNNDVANAARTRPSRTDWEKLSS